MYSRRVHIIAWRGLAALLILDEGQCEGLNTGMGRSRLLPCLFCFQTLTSLFTPNGSGRREAQQNINNMKRIFLSLIAAIAFGVGAMAQDGRVATLQHGSNIRAYYGPDALAEAHDGAVDGDIITLSADEFNKCNITKAITIRGAGMDKTVITGSGVTFTIPHESAYSLKLEGLSVNMTAGNSISFNGTDGTEMVVISKCYLGAYYGTSFTKCNAVVVQSFLNAWYSGDSGVTAKANANVTCINSKLRDMDYSDTGKFDVQNCVIIQSPNVKYSSIKNSIIHTVTTLDETNITSNCLVKNGSSGFANSWYVKTEAEPDPWNEDPDPVLWENLFTGTYQLTEEAAATYLGTDGTQVGIYGGTYPYETTPDYPLVKRLDVIGSHKDGKLNVKINVE